MSADIIDGKEIAGEMRQKIKDRVMNLKKKNIVPGLSVILVGDDPASQVYVRNKEKACKDLGIKSKTFRLPRETSQAEVINLIKDLNKDPEIHGILVQLPLPDHVDPDVVIEAIDPSKDVDGLHPVNMGRLIRGQQCLMPCTPHGCIIMIKRTGIDIKGKKAVVVGRSNIVGKPVSIMLLQENATVTVCHSKTVDLEKETREADILVVAVGKPKFIKGDMIKPGAVVIDVGINRLDNGKLAGDVDFESASKVAGWITPVPGGVGPMTITMLMHNTVEAAERLC
ncbi:MAG TPA: bifunctional methylenetetrahydrofolate dehydrogenase/methenyltetrahydrofolate cyclohydrolase FolD [Peptococcaceae bacterium]|nr:MAG: Bifunctional protein FolD [Clostridia bacterium 41_269]HBT20447.1 bifunctional methylenetetrahydrofolate dehydrogenase/methenyltetrahydrofolate cyclohydrolase FolD [Peptococcaceae bacterium]